LAQAMLAASLVALHVGRQQFSVASFT